MRSWLNALGRLRGSPRRAYDLDVVDQWVVVLLERYREATYRRLEAELAAIRATPPAEVVASLLKLEEQVLIERIPTTELVAVEPRFRLSRSGRRARAFMPLEPRSPTIFYL